jgi:hypothetical protein
VGQPSPYVSRKGVHTSPRFRGWRRGIPERGESDLFAPLRAFERASVRTPGIATRREPSRSEWRGRVLRAKEGVTRRIEPSRSVLLPPRSRPPERLRRESLSRVRPSSRSSARSSEVCASWSDSGSIRGYALRALAVRRSSGSSAAGGLGAGGRQLPVTVAKRALLAVLLHANRVVTRQNSVSPSGRTILSLGGHDR